VLAVVALAARAQVTFEAVTRMQSGESPRVVFHAAGDGVLAGSLTCGGAPAVPISANLRAGGSHAVSIPGVPVGSHPCTGTLRLETPDGGVAELPLSFTVEVRTPLEFRIEPTDWDAASRTLALHPSRPLRSAEAEVLGEGGRVIDRATAILTDPSSPTLAVTTTEEVLRIVVTAEDDAGIRAQLTLSPWFYAIPHEDVVFGSGSAVITTAEAPKLAQVWGQVAEVLRKYGSVVEIRLYVAGYTDTVGSAASNRALSRARAEAIARWFVGRGFPGEVWYQGFGEDVLAVPTPDETDQVANRRALYLLAADAPPPSSDLPAADWVRLR
jgi:outer membrane protein OmpA-like peptidoglycan-associated protein